MKNILMGYVFLLLSHFTKGSAPLSSVLFLGIALYCFISGLLGVL
jgi:hypothetical protein